MTSFTIKGNSVLQTSALKIEQEKITIRLHVNLQQDQRICLLLKKLQLSFLRKVSIMHWIIEMWYYGQEEDDLNTSARTVLHILLFIMFCCFQRRRMGGIQEFQFVVLNLENEGRMQGKEIERNGFTHR